MVHRLIGALGYTAVVSSLRNQPNPAGTGNGAAVNVSFANTFVDQYGVGTLPDAYVVIVTPSQSCNASVSAKTSSGFVVTLTPASGVTLATGTFDVLVHS